MTDKAKVLQAIKKMQKRTTFTEEHRTRTNKIFDEWGKVPWTVMMEHIKNTMQFIQFNKKNFPNHDLHLDQWGVLLDIARDLANRED